MSEKTSFDGVARYFRKLRAERLPKAVKALGDKLVIIVIAEGQANMNGRLMAKNGPHAALARYYGAALKANIDYDKYSIMTGLPAEEEQARIIAHHESGGAIVPRKRQYLRIATEASLLPSGFERGGFTGVSLHERIGTPGNPFHIAKPRRVSVCGLDEGKPVAWPGPGTPVLMLKGQVRYILTKSVTRQAYPNVENAVDEARRRVPELAEDLVRKLEAQS